MSNPTQNAFDEGKIPVAIEFKDSMLWVTLKDGRVIGTPLGWYPRLVQASPQQLDHYELWAYGIHWPDLDEDLGIEGMLLGVRPPSARTMPEGA